MSSKMYHHYICLDEEGGLPRPGLQSGAIGRMAICLGELTYLCPFSFLWSGMILLLMSVIQ